MRWIVLACLIASPALAQEFTIPQVGYSAIVINTRTADGEYKLVVEMKMDGSVVFGEGFTADDASREFWKYLGQNIPNKCEAAK